MARSPTRKELAEFEAEHGGVVDLIVVRRQFSAALVLMAAAGDEEAIRIASCIYQVLQARRPPCMLCGGKVGRSPKVFVLIRPHREDPENVLACALCDRDSAQADDEICRRLVVALNPDAPLRLLDLAEIGPAGTA